MAQDPIRQLLDAHVTLRAGLEPLRSALRQIATGNAEAAAATLPTLRESARMLNTDLIAHAQLEDEVFFPAIESAMGGGFGPTTVMRREHLEIHAGAMRFRETVRQLHEVQHPAIVEGGAKLGAALETGDTRGLGDLLTGLLALIDDHFAKEEQVLFPMTRELLDEASLREVGARMEQFVAATRS